MDSFQKRSIAPPSPPSPPPPFFLPLADPKTQLELAYRSLLESRNAAVQAKIQEEQARFQYEALARYLNKQAGNDQAINFLLQQYQQQQQPVGTALPPAGTAVPDAMSPASPAVSSDPAVQAAKQQAAMAQQQYLQDLYSMRQAQLQQQQGLPPGLPTASLPPSAPTGAPQQPPPDPLQAQMPPQPPGPPPPYTPSAPIVDPMQQPANALQHPPGSAPPPYPPFDSRQQPMAPQPQQILPGGAPPPSPYAPATPSSPQAPLSPYGQVDPMQQQMMAAMQPQGAPPPPYAPVDPMLQQQMAAMQQQAALQPPGPPPPYAPVDPTLQQQQMDPMLQQQAGMPPQAPPPSGQPGTPPQQPGMPPFEQLNQALIQGDPASRWAALEQLGTQGFAPRQTYEILRALAKPGSPLLPQNLPPDKKRELRQAAFWTLALLDNAQNASVPGGTPFRDPSGKPLTDPKTGKPLLQLLPGLNEAMATLSNKKEDPQVQRAAIQMLQELLKSRPGDSLIQGILKATMSSDPNVKAMAQQALLAKAQPSPVTPSQGVAGKPPAAASAA